MQYFCCYPGYDDKKLPFDPSLMVYFRKRLTPEILGSVNEMIIAKATKSDEKDDENEEVAEKAEESESVDDDDDSNNSDNGNGDGNGNGNDNDSDSSNDSDNNDDDPDNGSETANISENSGTMIIDATCAPSNIRYPQDVSLLDDAREEVEKLIDELHSPEDGKKPRTYRMLAHKDYLKYARCRKHNAKTTRKAIGR